MFRSPMPRVFGLLTLVLSGVLPACDNKDACKKVPECLHQGKCTAEQSGACKVGSDQDCRASEPCKLHGKCTAKDGACTAQFDDDCKTSEDCQKLSTCNVYNGSCADLTKSFHPECAKTCPTEGKCVMKAGQCVALSRQHCAGTSEETEVSEETVLPDEPTEQHGAAA